MFPLFVANWKMNETPAEAQALVRAVKQKISPLDTRRFQLVLCPPYTDLPAVRSEIGPFSLGAQDLHWEDRGTATGEISGAMLKDLGCQYVIVGHSERRWKLGESDAVVSKKLAAAVRHRLIPILCVGERAAERAAGQTETVLVTQLQAVLLPLASEKIPSLVVAYEPVWAIGTGQVGSRSAATAEIISQAYVTINKKLDQLGLRSKTKLIYGGSVDSHNVKDFFKIKDNQGFLIGGASLVADEMAAIIKQMVDFYGKG
jgi:triosephosphate isomerase